jgi:hypothetical protein
MTHLLTIVALGLAICFVSIPGEAASTRIHVTSKLLEQKYIGDQGNPQLGDQLIYSGDLSDDSGTKIGVGAAVCTTVRTKESYSPVAGTGYVPYTLECHLSATLNQGQIIFGGAAPFPDPSVVSRFGIVGGTDAFREARGEAILVMQSTGGIEITFNLE